MKRRLALLTEIIAPYRIPVFNALAQREEIDLHVIFLAETDSTLRQWLVYKDEIRFSYQVLPSWRRTLGKHTLLFNWGLRAALRGSSPDVIICGGYNYLASWQSQWWARSRSIPFLVWVESTAKDLRSGSLLVESLKAKFMNSCDAFVVAGKSSLEYVRNFGVSPEKIYTAPDAVDIDFFRRTAEMVRSSRSAQRATLRLPSRFFLFVGRLVPEKGVFDLLEAYGRLAPQLRSEVGLVFVGDGAARAELERCAATIAPGAIQFAGFAQREQLATYYAMAEAFVFPTHTDPWGLVVNEAMACGLPVIATSAAGCTADLVEDRWNGRVVPAGDANQLALAMQELADSADLRCVMGQRSRERIQQYSPEACAAGFADAVVSCGVPRYA
jgi:glycosyltransferase involved in cell wall biosynthesis